MMNQDELRDFLYLTEKHRAAYAALTDVSDEIKREHLRKLDEQAKWCREKLRGAPPPH